MSSHDPSRSDGTASLPFAVHLRPGRTTRTPVVQQVGTADGTRWFPVCPDRGPTIDHPGTADIVIWTPLTPVASTSEAFRPVSGVGPSVARTSVRLPAQEWWVRATHP